MPNDSDEPLGTLGIQAYLTLGSNTPKVEVPKSAIANSIHVQTGHTAATLRPIIDKLSLTIKGDAAFSYLSSGKLQDAKPLALSYWNGIFNLLDSAAANSDVPEITHASKKLPKYKRSYSVVLDSGQFYFSARPVSVSNAPLRIEFNPANTKAGAFDDLCAFWSSIDYDNIPFGALVHDARVTRLDIAIDILNFLPADIYVRAKKTKKIWIAVDPDSGVETSYYYWKTQKDFFGPNTPADLAIYDKGRQLEAMGLERIYGNLPHTRIELRLRKSSKLGSLPALKWPYKDITFRRGIVFEPIMDQRLWSIFLDSVRYRGLKPAVSLLPEDLSEGKTLDPDKHAPTDIVRENDVWPFWHEAIERAHLGKLIECSQSDIADLLKDKEGEIINFD